MSTKSTKVSKNTKSSKKTVKKERVHIALLIVKRFQEKLELDDDKIAEILNPIKRKLPKSFPK